MNKKIQPKIYNINSKCATCNFEFKTISALNKNYVVDTCSSCHPFYTGKQKFSTKGRVEKFKQKLSKKINISKK